MVPIFIITVKIMKRGGPVARQIPRNRTLILLLSLALTAWLCIPRISRDWDIEPDEEKDAGKDRYLKELSRYGSAREGRPNILIILADDLGRNDISLYSPDGVATPHIDAIAEKGITFADASATAAICAPSRAGLLTGRLQNRAGFDSQPMTLYPSFPLLYYGFRYLWNTDEMHPIRYDSYPSHRQRLRQGVPGSEIMLSEALAAAGYATALTGKWHLGYGEEQHPNSRGFDEFYGFLEAFSFYDDPSDEEIVSFRHDLFWEKHIWNKKRKGPSAIQRNGKVLKEERYLTDAIARESLAFMQNHVRQQPEDPFFVYASFNAPHTPFQATREYYDRFDHITDENRRVYCAMIAQLDDAVGEILAGLEDLGIADDTLIFFTSDNGGAAYTGATDNGPLAGGKFSQFEGGLEVPFMMRWDGRVPSGAVYDRPVSLADIFTTALGAAGLPLPADRIMDGTDLVPHVTGEVPEDPHDILFWKSDFNLAVRKGDWKLILNTGTGRVRLYDLSVDRSEREDLSDRYPEVVRELKEEAERRERECRPPLWPRVMNFEMDIYGETFLFAT